MMALPFFCFYTKSSVMNGSRKRVIVGAGAALENAMFLPGRKTYDFVLSSKRQESFLESTQQGVAVEHHSSHSTDDFLTSFIFKDFRIKVMF